MGLFLNLQEAPTETKKALAIHSLSQGQASVSGSSADLPSKGANLTEEYFFTCPYCWERISMLIDCSAARQLYVEDCEVCCQPIEVRVRCSKGRVKSLEAEQAQ